MKINRIGAAGGKITGSCSGVQTKHRRIRVDCGLFQVGEKSEALHRPPLAPDRSCDAVALTHGEGEPRAALAKLTQQKFRRSAMGEALKP